MANLGLEMAAHFALQGTNWHGMIGMLEDPRPVYGVYRLYAHWGTTQIAVESSDEALLPAFASLRDDGSLALLVVNKDPAQARETTVNVRGFRVGKQARVWLQDEEHPTATELPAISAGPHFSYTFPPYSVTLFIFEPAPKRHWLPWAGAALALLALAMLAVIVGRRRGVRRNKT
jgi:hypothetical protein